MIQRYADRPRKLEDMCLADFWFKVVYRNKSALHEDDDDETKASPAKSKKRWKKVQM